MKWSLSRLGGVAMAAVAVISLGATVATARSALGDATALIARGQGDVVLGAISTELAAETQPPSVEALKRVLAAHEAEGLRYVAFVERDGHPVSEAGLATMPPTALRPGAAAIEGRRVRSVGILVPSRLPFEDMPGLNRPPGPHGPHEMVVIRRIGPIAPLIVVELEPPMIATLQHDLFRIQIVASIASAILLAFAFAWSRSARRVAAFEERAGREQRLVALGSMSSVMAHEIRNPLASLKGHAQLLCEQLSEEGADPKRRAKAERVVAEAERLEVLTTSLLDFVRDGPISRAEVATSELIERALDGLPRARVRVDLSRAPARIDADVDRLSRSLHNVVDNALKATEDGEVELAISAEEKRIAMTIRDHGPGLPAGEESRIFEPFVTTRTRGTGLGLAVARRIAEQHGGTLEGATHPEGGAVFTIRIPS